MSARQSAAMDRALELVSKGLTRYAAAKAAGVSLSAIYRAYVRQQEREEKMTSENRDNLPARTDIRFNRYHVTNGQTKARVWYSVDNRIDGKRCVTIYAKDHSDNLDKIFGSAVQNNTDIMTDYFEKSRVVLFVDHPLFPAARKRAEEIESEWKQRVAG